MALLGVANYLEGASCVFRCLRLYLYFITDIPGPRVVQRVSVPVR